jgi:hypothetical protein
MSDGRRWNLRGLCNGKAAWTAAFLLLSAVAPLTAQDHVQDHGTANSLIASATPDAAFRVSPASSLSLRSEGDLPDSPLPADSDLQAPAEGQSTPQAPAQSANPDTSSNAASEEASRKDCKLRPCAAKPIINWYMRFEDGPQVKPMTPKEKGWLAARNLIEPFNLLTIVGTAGITIAADSHSAYGPGFPGFGRYVGVTFTEDMTGEFFNTFLIPSITHQDPHYHRMPKASYSRRIFHAISQVAWTQGDDGKGMPNYGNLVGFAIDDEIGNLYVPGRQTNAGATAQRYAIGLATAPIDNFITEFLPDVAKHVHVQVVVVQRIINQIANKDSGGAF